MEKPDDKPMFYLYTDDNRYNSPDFDWIVEQYRLSIDKHPYIAIYTSLGEKFVILSEMTYRNMTERAL